MNLKHITSRHRTAAVSQHTWPEPYRGNLSSLTQQACATKCHQIISTPACLDFFQREWYGELSSDTTPFLLLFFAWFFVPALLQVHGVVACWLKRHRIA